MGRITIVDLEVFYRVGVEESERSKPQRLLISVDMELDFTMAARTDRVERTVDYFAVAQELLKHGEGRSWKLLERLVTELSDLILTRFKPEAVTVEVKKFPLPQARYVSVSLSRGA